MGNKILAFDIGTNSAGWALIEDGEKIIDCGVRIFEMGNKMDKEREISRKGDRTIARGARRRNQRHKLRRKMLKEMLKKHDMLPDMHIKGEKGTNITSSYELYRLRKLGLQEKLNLKDLGKVLLYFNKKRGFKSSRKEELNDNSEQGKVKSAITELKAKIEGGGYETVGAYFFDLKEAHHNGERLTERILGHWIGRDQYMHEFEKIWNKQQQYYPEVLTEGLKTDIRDRMIFFQRKLKSQKHLVSKCRLEPSKRVAPKSSMAFQEFRLWSQLANIRVSYEHRQFSPLTLEEKQHLANQLWKKDKLSHTQIIKELGFPSRITEFNDIDELKGITTYVKLLNAIGPDFEKYDTEKQHQLWHTLFFFDDTNKLKEYAVKAFDFDEDTAEKYSRIKIEPDYGSISHKAIKKLLPELKRDKGYAEACKTVGYHHSYNADAEQSDRVLEEFVPQLKTSDVRNPVVQKSVNECIGIANQIIREYGKPDIVRIELSRELKKPKHKREEARRQNREREGLRKLQAEFLNKTGLFSQEISWKSKLIDKYQLWLELGYEDVSHTQFPKFAGQVKSTDLEKYRLWLEANRISPYSGKAISLKRLFDPDIEIEHIIPYSISMDNSFMNKTLSEYDINKVKKNRLPYHYFKDREAGSWEAFTRRIAHMPAPKREKLMATEIPDDFLNSQLTNTGYIGKALTKQLKKAIQTVQVRNGQATAILRREWQLNSLLHYKVTNPNDEQQVEVKNMMKNRKDHRHHALDAIVIGCTTQRHIQLLSSASHLDDKGMIENDEIEEPWRHFRAEVGGFMDKLFVSHSNKKRLLTNSKNKYRHWSKNKPKPAPQITKAARGALHEETHYGQITHPDTGKPVYVSKKDVATIKENQIDKVVDVEIRLALRDHFETKGKIDHDKQPLIIMRRMYGSVRPIQVRHVRVINSATRMVQLRPKENENLFVPTGSNYCIAIYEDFINGKWVRDFVNVPFLEAVLNSREKKPLYPSSIIHKKTGSTLNLSMVLKAKDMLVMYEQDEDEINWTDPYELFERLYYIVWWAGTSGQLFLYKHHMQEENVDKSPKPILIRQYPTTLKGVKVKIDRLGRLTRL